MRQIRAGAAEPTGSADEIVKNNPPRILVAASVYTASVEMFLLYNLACVNVCVAFYLQLTEGHTEVSASLPPCLPSDKPIST